MNIEAYFAKLRLTKKHHLGLGDIRLTLAQQEDICQEVKALREWIEREGQRGDVCTYPVLHEVCENCACKRKKED